MDLCLQEEVEEQLTRGSVIRLPARLAVLYETRRGPARKRRMAIAMLIAAAGIAGAIGFEWLDAPDLLPLALVTRIGTCLLCLIAAVGINRLRPGWPEQMAYGVAALVLVASNAFLGELVPEAFADRYMLVTIAAAAALCAVPPVPVLTGAALATSSLAAITLCLSLMPGTLPLRGNFDIVLFGAGALAVTMVVAVRHEASRRRAFLHALREELTARELYRMNAELVHLTNTDVLTGIDNRRKFEADMRHAWSGRGRAGLGVLILDIDYFKLFNDSAGHAMGDRCLRQVAATVSASVRGSDIHVARYGGEEFVVLAPGLAHADLAGLAERVRLSVERLGTPHPARPDTCLTISVGAAWCQSAASFATEDDLLRAADQALYAAKLAGRNRVVLYGDLRRAEVVC